MLPLIIAYPLVKKRKKNSPKPKQNIRESIDQILHFKDSLHKQKRYQTKEKFSKKLSLIKQSIDCL